MTFISILVREMRIELTREYHTPLKRTRLPVPPLAQLLVLDNSMKYLNKKQDYLFSSSTGSSLLFSLGSL